MTYCILSSNTWRRISTNWWRTGKGGSLKRCYLKDRFFFFTGIMIYNIGTNFSPSRWSGISCIKCFKDWRSCINTASSTVTWSLKIYYAWDRNSWRLLISVLPGKYDQDPPTRITCPRDGTHFQFFKQKSYFLQKQPITKVIALNIIIIGFFFFYFLK